MAARDGNRGTSKKADGLIVAGGGIGGTAEIGDVLAIGAEGVEVLIGLDHAVGGLRNAIEIEGDGAAGMAGKGVVRTIGAKAAKSMEPGFGMGSGLPSRAI